jgi:sugar-specific transcriptional regulator TrmB
MIEKVLEEIGLTKNEIRVYTALLRLGKSKTGEILKESGLNSGKIYEILDSLQKKGLTSSIKENNIKYFSPANPKRVLEYLEEKNKEIEKQKQDYKNILPEILSSIEKSDSKSKVEIFTGLKGMKTAFQKELEHPNKTLHIWGVLKNEYYPEPAINFFIAHGKERERNKIKIKKILSQDSKIHRKAHEKSAQIKYLPYVSSTGISVIGNLSIISIFSDNPIFITIEDESVAKGLMEQFEFLWNISKN